MTASALNKNSKSRLLPIHTLPWRVTKNIWRNCCLLIYRLTISLPLFHFIRNTKHSHTPRTLTIYLYQKVVGINKKAYWPVHFTSKINQPQNIVVGIETCPGYEPGCYIQGLGRIEMGDYCRVAQNVGIISANHRIDNPAEHDKTQAVIVGDHCWIGMNAVILPGVTLGDFTVVGAGSVVTKSFPEGYCIVGGNPAKLIKTIDPEICVRERLDVEYVGYIPAENFQEFRTNRLSI